MTISTSNKVIRILLIALVIVIAVYPLFSKPLFSASLTAMSDTMSRQDNSTLSSHDILFTMSNSFATTNTIAFDFGEDNSRFVVDNSGWVVGDFDFNDGTERVIYGVTQATSPTDACSGSVGVNDVGVEVDTDDGIITVRGCGSMTASGGTPTINFEIGSAAAGPGTNRITNPSGTGSFPISITETTDSGTLAVPILSDDQVVVSATVDPTITSTLSSNACNLATLTSSAINTCNYTNTVTTNASSGYVARLLDLSSVTAGKLCSPSAAVCTNDINRTTGNVDLGSEEYGVATDRSAQDLADYGTGAGECTTPDNPQEATALSSDQVTAQSYGSSSGPVSAEVSRLCHAASITGTTPAGSYTGTVTHITTGTF